MKSEFMTAITQLAAEKGVPSDTVVTAIQDALVSAYKKDQDDTRNISADIDPGNGTPRVYHWLTVVDEVPDEEDVDDSNMIIVEQARKLKNAEGEIQWPEAQPGDQVYEDVTPPAFGRIAAQMAKQVVMQKLRDAERDLVFKQFEDRKDEIVHGVIQRIENRTAVVEIERAEAVMPPQEQVPTERYYQGQRLRVYVADVRPTPRGPQIIVSRAHRLMLRRLFEQEVPEIFSGAVEIKAIAREAGFRSKVAVFARQEGIDPVGSCVGVRGVRIQNIVNELNGEKIDVVPWDEDPGTYVGNALSPAQVTRVSIDEPSRTAKVLVPERQLSLAIGKEGQNARLAAKLTGWRIDIKSDSHADEGDGPRRDSDNGQAAIASGGAAAVSEAAPDGAAGADGVADVPDAAQQPVTAGGAE
ncbi:MAG: transcription termination/antitermination protein NusA [Chloroflexi bacterium]|nr:transcription termination/antitermination protein NusA [Chloroflexota bacterium]